MGFRYVLPVLSLLVLLIAPPVYADENLFEQLRNNPEPARRDDGGTESTASDTPWRIPDGLRLSPLPGTVPPLRTGYDTLALRYRPGDTPLLAYPSLRLILPPVEPVPDRAAVRLRTGPDTGEAAGTTPPGGVRYGRVETTKNVTAPFTNRFFVGIRWPGVSVGFHEPPYTLEFKYLKDPSDVTIVGLRLYHHAIPLHRTNYYWGLDLSRINFEGAVSEGDGTSTGLFFGFHREVAPHLSWSLDMGPYYIYLRDDATRLSADGLEFTITTGVNFELW